MEKSTMFEKDIKIEKEKLTITVTCEKRRNIYEPKTVYKEKIETLIPQELKGKVNLVSKPEDKLSNMAIPGHCQTAVWVYEIVNVPSPAPQKPKRATRRRRSSAKKTS